MLGIFRFIHELTQVNGSVLTRSHELTPPFLQVQTLRALGHGQRLPGGERGERRQHHAGGPAGRRGRPGAGHTQPEAAGRHRGGAVSFFGFGLVFSSPNAHRGGGGCAVRLQATCCARTRTLTSLR